MAGHSTRSSLEVAELTDPAALLDHARALEPLGWYAERRTALTRLQDLLAADAVAPAPDGRDWRLELMAERAVDATRERALGGRALVDQVLKEADGLCELALGRALLAGGQQLAWEGTDTATAQARREFLEAAKIFAALGHRDWQGSALLRCGYSAHYQYGDLVGAEELIGRALQAYESGERRDAALTYYSDVLIDLGEFDRAEQILAEAAVIAERRDDRRSIPEIIWGQGRVAAGRGDPRATERLLREAERAAVDAEWFETHVGGFFLLEAAELLDRVGLTQEAQRFFERATAPARAHARDWDESVMQTRAMLLARSGDPLEALEALQEIVRGDWLEKRLVWRQTLMTSWATFRAGREGAGSLAAGALHESAMAGGGGTRVARAACLWMSYWSGSSPRRRRRPRGCGCGRSSAVCARSPARSWSEMATACGWCPLGSTPVSSWPSPTGSAAPVAHALSSSPTQAWHSAPDRCCPTILTPSGRGKRAT